MKQHKEDVKIRRYINVVEYFEEERSRQRRKKRKRSPEVISPQPASKYKD